MMKEEYFKHIVVENTDMLKNLNPDISTYRWLNRNNKISEIFSNTLVKCNSTAFGKNLRQVIDEFDKTVNPYINSIIEFENVDEFLEKVKITANVYDSKNDKKLRNCCDIHIIDKNSNNQVSIYRSPQGFSYQLHYKLDNDKYLCVAHYFNAFNEKEEDNGEFIYINYYGENEKENIEMKYNLTKDIIDSTYEEKNQATYNQKQVIYDELLNAIDLAKTITKDNMKAKDNGEKVLKLMLTNKVDNILNTKLNTNLNK